MDRDAVVQAMRAALGAAVGEPRTLPVDDLFVSVELTALRAAVELLQNEFDIWHLSTVTGLDDGEQLLLHYHFWQGSGLTLSVSLPYERAEAPTLSDLIEVAGFYEREVAEMLGVTFVGNADLRPLLLPDDWDEGPPLRRHVDGQGGQ